MPDISFTSIVKAHENAVRLSFDGEGEQVLTKIMELLAETLKRGNKILLCGNGGSAADSQHIAAEFVGRFKKERRALPAISLTTDTSALTCIANDYSFDVVFSRQVEALGDKGDVLIAISTSGASKNVLAAVKAAKAKGITTVGFSGRSGGELKKIADHCFVAKAQETSHIQEVHSTALHAICEILDHRFEK